MALNDNVMETGEWPPPGVNTTVPHSARMYDWWLGGKDNFAVDRAMAESFLQAIPDMRVMARENRAFLHRVTRYLTREAGIRQFLDIGTGIPTSPNLHEVAQEIAPETRVVYVDNDPIVLAHARALMVSEGPGATAYIDADLRAPERILASPELGDTLDLNRPVGLTLAAILMLISDEDDPWGTVHALQEALPSGSYLAISHPSHDFNPEAVARTVEAATQGGMTLVPRDRASVARFFGDWEMVEPGLVPLPAWRPDDGPSENPDSVYYWGGLARKP